jgi:predicted enzyme related to lactoylglutathione lyase
VFSLIASDVDGWYAKLAAAGATILDPPRRDPKFGLYRMFAADPAGNILEVQEHPAASAKVAD